MRKFLRRSLTIVSFLCLTALVVLWVRSRWANDVLAVRWGRHTEARWRFVDARLVSQPGEMRVYVEIQDTTDPSLVRFYRKFPVGPTVSFASGPARDARQARAANWWNRIGLYHERYVSGAPLVVFEHLIGFPHWLFLPFFAVMPVMAVRRACTRRWRRRAGLCLNCGYDLRASGERCPECGEEIRGMGNLPMHSAAQQHA
jgi:hypothetical protein